MVDCIRISPFSGGDLTDSTVKSVANQSHQPFVCDFSNSDLRIEEVSLRNLFVAKRPGIFSERTGHYLGALVNGETPPQPSPTWGGRETPPQPSPTWGGREAPPQPSPTWGGGETPPQPAPKGEGARGAANKAVAALRDKLTRLDARYQQWMEMHVDTLMDGKRQQHGETLEGEGGSTSVLLSDENIGVSIPELEGIPIVEQKKETNRGIGLSLLLTGVAVGAKVAALPAALVCLPLGLYIMRHPFRAAYNDITAKRKIGDPALASILMIGTFGSGFFVVGGVASIFYYASTKLILLTQDSSRRKLVNIMGQMPDSVWMLIDGQECEAPLSQVQEGDTIVVGAGQVIPVDGVVVAGNAMIDQHRLTGESQPAEKASGDPVLAATMVMTGSINIRVTQTGTATAAAKIGEILNNTANCQLGIESKAMQFVDRAALPTLLAAGVALPLVGLNGAVAVTAAALGYNVRLSAPIAMLNYLNLAAEQGILVKDGRSLELLPTIDTVIFDKTGTLTEEQPRVSRIHCVDHGHGAGSADEELLLACAAAIEARQSHPIARAIVAAAHERKLTLPTINDAHYMVGYGMKALIHGRLFHIGSGRFMGMEQIALPPAVEQIQQAAHRVGHSLVMIAMDYQLVGAIELEPTIRAEVAEIIATLHERNLEVYIISGDQEEPTRKLAHRLGIDHYFANTLPDDKAAHVERLQAEGRKVCFVGDGINDSLALRQADVSVSLRGATSVATDTAQIVLMHQSLRQLPTLLKLADEFNGNMKSGYAAAVIPGVITIGGVFLVRLGILAATLIYNVGLLTSLGIAMSPLLLHRVANTVSIPGRKAPHEPQTPHA